MKQTQRDVSIFCVIVLFMLHLQNVFENNKDKILMNVRTNLARSVKERRIKDPVCFHV